ncbi:hypothetical protein OQH61_01275 [Helicobacter sp. MIT 21-1697]|uniref:hypothetical protein n=1 Tax=Helicobacter sp. MIT 21-1697 TaxID=2993733 RepID=UPI00224A82CD|nr:hypothetical protein [Helicobacter sp. MIT 21-1697]MCX2716371.1 hypothetical protein [Helicobacter sp. MIT 21-1697]
MNTPYTTKSGEITTKAQLISEIEQLLNAIPTSHTTLSPAVMGTLSCVDLENVRDTLLQKSNDVIAQNKQWLLGLANE